MPGPAGRCLVSWQGLVGLLAVESNRRGCGLAGDRLSPALPPNADLHFLERLSAAPRGPPPKVKRGTLLAGGDMAHCPPRREKALA